MRILFISNHLDQFKIEKETTLSMMRVSASAGHEIWHCCSENLAYIKKKPIFFAKKIKINSSANTVNWYETMRESIMNPIDFNVIVMRKDPPVNTNYIVTTWMLSEIEKHGGKIINSPNALRNFSEKLGLFEFINFAPPTIVSCSLKLIKDFHKKHKDIIIKPLNHMGGTGVFRIQSNGINLSSVVEILSCFGKNMLMIQKFIPEVIKGDRRVLLINGEPVPFALVRIPQNDEVRCNLAVGGIAKTSSLTNREMCIIKIIGPKLAKRGFHLIGLDFIGEYLTEINITSPTGFVEIMKETGYNASLQWLNSIESLFS